jgi:PTS system mannose-specific IID component
VDASGGATVTRVRRRTLARSFWRALFLQAGWNRRGMQNLGFAYAILPALCDLYRDDAARQAALARHLGFFNCHPYMAAAILGGAIHHEERVARGEEPPAAPSVYKQTLQGPLAAIGDGFFWTALRPFFGALAAAGALAFGWPAVVVALSIYNSIHLALRIWMFRAGYRQGDAVVADIARLSLPVAAERLRLGAASLCGVAAAIVLLASARAAGPFAAALTAAGALLGYAALALGARLLPAAYAALLAGAGAAAAARLTGSP